MPSAADIAASIRSGDRRALARGLTLVENETTEGRSLLEGLGQGSRAHRVGLTGPPGVGKSTLVSALTRSWRAAAKQVGILAIDPSSPFTGGALLGDRIRMLSHAGDDGVFVRSLASRGAWGGLSAAVYDSADLLEAAGFDPVLIESVGVGQGEVEICRAADTSVVVLAPGSGDIVQGMKAGLLEIADVIVINQADRDGADALGNALEGAQSVRSGGEPPPILRTVATDGEGVDELRAWLDTRAHDLDESLQGRRILRATARIRGAVDRSRAAAFWAAHQDELEALSLAVVEGRLSPAAAVRTLLGREGECDERK